MNILNTSMVLLLPSSASSASSAVSAFFEDEGFNGGHGFSGCRVEPAIHPGSGAATSLRPALHRPTGKTRPFSLPPLQATTRSSLSPAPLPTHRSALTTHPAAKVVQA